MHVNLMEELKIKKKANYLLFQPESLIGLKNRLEIVERKIEKMVDWKSVKFIDAIYHLD